MRGLHGQARRDRGGDVGGALNEELLRHRSRRDVAQRPDEFFRVAADGLRTHGRAPEHVAHRRAAPADVHRECQVIIAVEEQKSDQAVRDVGHGRTGGTAGVSADKRSGLVADVGAPAREVRRLVERAHIELHLGLCADEPAVGRPKPELRRAGRNRRHRRSRGRDEVADGQPRPAGVLERVAGDFDAADRAQYLGRHAGRDHVAVDGLHRGHADGVRLLDAGVVADQVEGDPLVRVDDAAAYVVPRPRVAVGQARRPLEPVLALAHDAPAPGVGDGVENLVAGELDDPVGVGAVDADGHEEVDGRLIRAVGQVVVGRDRRLRVVHDVVLLAKLAGIRVDDIQIERVLRHGGAVLGPLTDFRHSDHNVAPQERPT